MATITTTLNTRIRLRYDTYDNWYNSNPVLLAGEVAIAVPGEKLLGSTEAAAPCLMKVGDGITEFRLLPWMSAVAADVHQWAKLPAADFKAWMEGSKTITGLSRPELATKGQVETLTTNLATLTSTVETLGTDLDNAEERIGTLESEMDTAQADIKELKDALNADDGGLAGKITALEGEVDKAQEDIQTNATNIATNTSNIEDNTEAIATLNGNDTTAGSVAYAVKQEADRAKGVENGLQTAINTLNADKNTAGSVDKKVSDAVAAETQARESAIAGLETEIGNVETTANAAKQQADTNKNAIALLNGTAETEGSVRHTAADVVNTLIGGANNADTITNVKTLIDYVNENGGEISELSTTVQGHTETLSTQAGQIGDLQEKDTELQNSINGINTTIGTAELATTDKTLIGAINETRAKIATDDATNLQAAKDYAKGLVDGLSGEDGALTSLNTRVTTNEGKLEGIDTTVIAAIGAAKTEAINTASADATSKANKAKEDAIAAAATDATSKANTAESNAKTYADGLVSPVSSDVATLKTTAITGSRQTVNSVDTLSLALNGSDLQIIFNCGTSAN